MIQPPTPTLAGQFAGKSDADLETMIDGALADLVLAERYEHNAKLVPPIKRFLDRIHAEQARRVVEAGDAARRESHGITP